MGKDAFDYDGVFAWHRHLAGEAETVRPPPGQPIELMGLIG